MFVQDFKILGALVSEKSLTKILTGRKEKWTNKGTHMQEDADSLLHDTSNRTRCLYHISVAPEKSLTQILLYIKLE